MAVEERRNKWPVVILALITGISVLGNEMLYIVMPIYWEFFGLTSIWQVGILLSANRIIRLFINSAVGWCYQRINKRTGVLIAVILATISTYSYGVLKGFWLLLAMRLLWGVAWSFLRLGGYLTVMSCSDEKTKGHFIGLYNGIWGLGTLVGMLVGGVFAGIIGIKVIADAFTILGVLSIPLVIYAIPNTLSVTKEEKSKENILKDRKLLLVLMNGLFVAFLVFGIYMSTLSKILEFHMSEPLIVLSVSFGAAALAGILQSLRLGTDPFIAPLIGRWSDQLFGRIPLLLFALFIGTICFIFIPIKTPFIVLILLILVLQLLATVLITASDTLAVDFSNGPQSVKIMTYYTLFVDIGAALGPLIGFFIIDFIGLNWLYWLTSFLMLMAIIVWVKATVPATSRKVLFHKAFHREIQK